MRFVADGPVIPDDLLEVRDEGQVVFLCGAGVSVPAGMPSFVQLTQDVLEHLHAAEDLPASRMFAQWQDGSIPVSARVPLDQIFNSLREAFGRDQVNAAVAKVLEAPVEAAMPNEHSIVARLSTDAEGNPQIVTTNFDLLFEHPGIIKSSYRVFEPPTFPDLRYEQPVSGLTYLHGRLRTDDTRPHDYILSSADFGRAYLAEGWATRFVRLLLEKYTVVLLGYQAEDPPVLYLLQGLNSTSALDTGRLYAFDRGAPEDVEAKWRNRGVTPIAYPGENHDHSRLWTSVEAWANRADDPGIWRSRVIDLAGRGPRALQAHERGQVAHVIRTNPGAREFADAEPVPPAEWLCVFDHRYRLADVEPDPETADEFVPRDHYALDDDPAEPPRDQPWHGDNLIAWRPGDEYPTSECCLSGTTRRGFEELPPRLFHLCRWIAANSVEPVVAWWAARQYRLHPRLASMISNHLERGGGIPESGRLVWDLIFEQFERGGKDIFNMKWFTMRRRIEQEGWTRSTLRALERCTEPAIVIGNMTGRARVKPPLVPWPEIAQNDIADFKVEFPHLEGEPLVVPDEVVGAVFAIASRNLIIGLERWEELGRSLSLIVTLYQDTIGPGEHYRSRAAEFVLWVADLMTRAAQLDPGRVAATVSLWPSGERFVLNKLRLFAWNLSSVFSGDQVATNLMALDQDSFWSFDDQREFLFLVRDRWDEFSDHEKTRLLERLLAGRDPYPGEASGDCPDHRDIEVVSRLRWMEQNGCAFPEGMPERTAEVQARLPEWIDAWAENAARSREGQAGSVEIIRDPSVFDGVPVPQIVEMALKHTSRQFAGFTNHRPFDGLVRADPERSLSALKAVAEKGKYPSDLWRTLIREWPEVAPHQATRLLCEQLRRLPDGVVFENRHDISTWMRDRLPTVAESDEELAFATLDDHFCRISAGGPDATRSGFGVASIGGRIVKRSRRTHGHAIKAPIGRMTKALLSILDARQLPQGHGMPDSFATRLERLLSAPGEGSDHAICLLANKLSWLHVIAPDWVQTHMLPWFTLNHPAAEPAWNGLLSGAQIVGPELFDTIKVPFLELFPRMYDWHWDDGMYRLAHQWLVVTAIWHQQEPRYTSSDEAAAAIRRLSEDGRSDVIRCLGRVGRNDDDRWTGLVIPFIRDVWPKEMRFQTERTSADFLSLFTKTGDAFPLVLDVVRDYLRPIRREHSSFYMFDLAGTDDEEPIAARFPKETLNLMDLTVSADPTEMPHNLSETLTLISETRPALVRDPRYVRLRKQLAVR